MASEDPYAPPQAEVSEPPEISIETPEEILKKIRQGWGAALFSAAMTLVVIAISVSGAAELGYSLFELFDVALILGLAFGIYKKSRTCAVIMLLYFIASKTITMVETGKPSGLLMGLLFAFFFWQGVSGTFAYHRFAKAKRAGSTSRG